MEGLLTLPVTTGPDGSERRVGLELEYAGVGLRQAAETVVRLYGGRIEEISRYQIKAVDTAWGDFALEIDTSILKEKRYEQPLKFFGINPEDESASKLEGSLLKIFSLLTPYEIVSPPLPYHALSSLEELREELRLLGAEGTGATLRYAFGYHLNVGVAELSSEYLLRILQAFVVLYPWLARRENVDIARRISPYIHEFPTDYCCLITHPYYQPDLTELITDYLHYNPTRNRPLDMLPIFACIDGPLVENGVQQARLVKARPAFHYRLPNCSIDRAEWRLAHAWNDWIAVERIAAAPSILSGLSTRYHNALDSSVSLDGWSDFVGDAICSPSSP